MQGLSSYRHWLGAGVIAAWSMAALSQPAGDTDSVPLPVVRCDPVANTCEPVTDRLSEVLTSPGDRAAIFSPDLTSAELQLDAANYAVLIPGCAQGEPGVMLCENLPEFHQCRTLMYSTMVYSCRIRDPFAHVDVVPIAAKEGEYRLAVESNARVRIAFAGRGFGEFRGDADVVLEIDPLQYVGAAACVERSQFLFRPTGREGGEPVIDEPTDCAEPIEFSFQAHEDDVQRAFDLCQDFAAWGEKLEDTIDIVAAGLFEVRSDSPEFRARFGSDTAIIAPYVNVEAPLTIDCRSN